MFARPAAALLVLAACTSVPPGETPPPAKPTPVEHPAVAAVKAHVAAARGIPVDRIELVRRDDVTWPNGALGCPEAGKMYTQATVPGFRIQVRDRLGAAPEIFNTDADGSRVVSCPMSDPFARQVREALAAATDSSADAWQLIERKRVNFTDRSLGCPEPGRRYPQGTTPGEAFVFEHPSLGRRELHVDFPPSHWVSCDRGRVEGGPLRPVSRPIRREK